MSSSDEVETAEVDCDTCKTDDLSELFDESLRIVSEEAISLEKDYILYLDNSRWVQRFDELGILPNLTNSVAILGALNE